MIGTKTAPAIKTKASETWTMVLFLLDEMTTHRCRFIEKGSKLYEAGDNLRTMINNFNDHGATIPMDKQRGLFEVYSTHVAIMEEYEVFTPKHHLMFHLLKKIDYQGNPTYYATWLDEGLNKVLKKTCRDTSAMTFEKPILSRMRRILHRMTLKRKRNRC